MNSSIVRSRDFRQTSTQLRDASRRDTKGPITSSPFYLGWLRDAFRLLNTDRSYVSSLTPGVIVTILGAAPLNSQFGNLADLVDACINVTQGSSDKAYGNSLMPGAGADLTLAVGPIATTRSFGVVIQLGDSVNGFKAGGYLLTLQDNATALYQVLVQVPAGLNTFTLIMLSAKNNGGFASIVPLVQPVVVIGGSAGGSATITSQTSVSMVTLNQRDIGSRSVILG